jgi:hypothetical protein
MNEVEIPIKISGIAALKAELKDLRDQMADATDPEAFAALADKAGDVQKQINKVNGAINDFKKGSNLDQAKASIDGIGESIMKLDFTKAAKQSANLKQTLGALKPKDLTQGFKGFTTTLKNLGGAFVKLGMTILMNPIFLLVAVIVAIVAAVALVLHKFGVLQVVLDAMMMPVNALIAVFEKLTDWMGLTDNAGEERGKNEIARIDREIAANEKRSAVLDEKNKMEMSDYDRKIALAKAEGKATYELQRAKIKASIAYQTEQIKESMLTVKKMKLELQNLQTLNISEEDRKERTDAANAAINKSNVLIAEMGNARLNSHNELKILNLDEQKAEKQKITEGRKGNGDKKNLLQQRLNDIKAFNADKEKLDSDTLKSEIALMKSGIDKDKMLREQAFEDYKKTFLNERLKKEMEALDKQFLKKKLSEEQYNAQLAELKLNGVDKLTKEELQILSNAEKLKNKELLQIEQTAANNFAAGQQMILDAKFTAMAEGFEKEQKAQAAQYEKLRADALANTTLTEEQKKALIAVYDEQEKAQIATKEAERKKAQEDLLLTLQDEATQLRAAENAQFALDVEAANGDYETLELLKKAHEDKLLNIEIEAANNRAAEAQKERDAKLSFAKDTVDGLTNLGGMLIKDQKKLEKFNKASALIQIGIDTAKAISALVAASNTNPLNGVTAGGAGIAQFASGIIQIATNVAKAKSILSSPSTSATSGGGGGGESGGGSSSTAQVVPQAAQLFGSANTGGTMNAGGTSTEGNTSMTVTAIVSESQVTSVQDKINRINKNSEL